MRTFASSPSFEDCSSARARLETYKVSTPNENSHPPLAAGQALPYGHPLTPSNRFESILLRCTHPPSYSLAHFPQHKPFSGIESMLRTLHPETRTSRSVRLRSACQQNPSDLVHSSKPTLFLSGILTERHCPYPRYSTVQYGITAVQYR